MTAERDITAAVAGILVAHGVDPDLAAAQARFCERLRRENLTVNLTGITDAEGMAVRHVLDSLAALPVIGAPASLVDLGSGGGVPGVPLALALPDARVVLVESRGRKAAALARIVEALGLGPRVEVVAERGEAWLAGHPVEVVVTRAVGGVLAQLRLLSPVRHALRRLVMYKGPGVEDELDAARRQLARLGFDGPAVHAFELPGGAGRRIVLEWTVRDA